MNNFNNNCNNERISQNNLEFRNMYQNPCSINPRSLQPEPDPNNCIYNNLNKNNTNKVNFENDRKDYIIDLKKDINNTNILLNNILNELKFSDITNYYEKITVNCSSMNRQLDEKIYNFKVNLNDLNLRNVIKCDLIKAVIPKTRQLLSYIPETKEYEITRGTSTNGDPGNDGHPLHNFTVINKYTTNKLNATDDSIHKFTIPNGNYTATELQDVIKSYTSTHAELINTVIDTEFNSITDHTQNTGFTMLKNNGINLCILKDITVRLGYILGFVAFDDIDPFYKVYAFVNNSGSDFSITVTYDNNISTNQTSGILSYENIGNNTIGCNNLSDFLNLINNNNTNTFKLAYDYNQHHYNIVNNNNTKTITNITISHNDFSNIIGFNTSNVSILPNKILKGIKKYIIETNPQTPNLPNDLSAGHGGNFAHTLISKYPIKFQDINYTHIKIPEISGSHNIIVNSKDKGLIDVIQSIDMNENYQGIAYYRANDIDLSLSKKFNPIPLKYFTLELLDEHCNYYNSESDWTCTIAFTIKKERDINMDYRQ